MNHLPYGIIPALVTPFTESGRINIDALRRLIRYSLDGGVDGLLMCGTTGEFFALDEGLREELLTATVECVAGQVPIWVGAGAVTTRDVISQVKHAERYRIEGVSVLTPYFISPSQEELYRSFVSIAESTSLPVVLYNNPARTHVSFTAQTVERLADVPNIVGIKDSSGDFTLSGDFVQRTMDKEFNVLIGRDTQILAALGYGAKGAVTTCGNIAPAICAGIYREFLAGRHDEALRLQMQLNPLRLAFSLGTFPQVIKEAVRMLGIDVGDCLPPIGRLAEAESQELERILKNLNLIGKAER